MTDEGVENNIACFVPLTDMFNYSDTQKVFGHFDNDKKGYMIYAVRDIKQGEEINSVYDGEITNKKLFTTFGFVYDQNDLFEV